MSDHSRFEDQQRFVGDRSLQHRSGEVSDEIRLRAERVLHELQSMPWHRAESPPEVLEVGCGNGWFAEKLVQIGRVSGVDISPEAIDVAKGRVPDAEFVCADFCKVGYPHRAFDVVVCLETLFYVDDPPHFVAELSRVLRPGGVLLLTTMNRFVYERRSDIATPKPRDTRNWLSKKEIRSLLRTHFDLEKELTVDPRGDRGLLGVVNSTQLNSVLGRTLGPTRVRRIKERAGLGGGVIYIARNP